MNKRSLMRCSLAGAITLGTAAAVQGTTFAGNGATGFGGPVGHGSLGITDDGAGNLTFTYNSPLGNLNGTGNDLAVYISTGASGLTDTSSLVDNGDSGRESVSGYNANNSSANNTVTRTLVTFAPGFQASYALSIQDNYVSLFQLPLPNTVNYLTYITGGPQNGTAPYSLTVPLSDLGLTQGQSFQFDGTLIADSTYRSNETIGQTSPDISTQSNVGYTNGITFSAANTFTTTAVPEPAGLAALGLVGTLASRRWRLRQVTGGQRR